MGLITWDDSYSVKIKTVDDQHKQLISIINELHDAMLQRKAKDKMGTILNDLTSYVGMHFSMEEGLFDKHKYPEVLVHKSEHKKFVAKVTEFKTKFDSGNITLTLEVMNFLKDWLLNHIKGTDMKYSKFLIDKGVK